MNTCPMCNGNGLDPIGAPTIVCTTTGCLSGDLVPRCELCHGTGEVTDGVVHNWEIGAVIRRNRIAADLGLRECARLFCLTGGELSRMELGIFREEE
jgi:hypothetical protein